MHGKMLASLATSSMSWPSEEHAPSAPRHTFIPPRAYLLSGATPLPRRRLLNGLCTAVASHSAMMAISSSSSHTQCPQVVPGTWRKPVSRRCFTAEPLGRNCRAISACARVSSR